MRKVMAPITTPPKASEPHRFKPGKSGNPEGRPRGSRNLLSEQFLKDILADWEVHGVKTINKFREERPHEYVKVVAGLVPRHFSMKVAEYDELSDEQLHAQLNAVLRQLAAAGLELGAGDEAAEGQEPAGTLSTLQ